MLLIDPRQPDVMYAGAVSGGVFKTTDGGASWTPLVDTMGNIAIASMDMDPSDPDVIYAGTGEGMDYRPARGAGIMKTTDAGATWAFLPSTSGPDFQFVERRSGQPQRLGHGLRGDTQRRLAIA